VFSTVFLLGARLHVIHARRILLAPRGELAAGASSLKRVKKRVFRICWAPVLRSLNVLWHAASTAEESEIRDAFPWARITVAADQLALPPDAIPAAIPEPGRSCFVFIGRLSPVKNVDLVLRSLREMATPMNFDIYGPIEDVAYWKKCRVLIEQMPAHVQVRYLGELPPQVVRDTFARYDAFVFPTQGESFGHAIAESLSASCPVVCSDKTPWTKVLEGGGGTVLHELEPSLLRVELERRAAMSPHTRWERKAAAGSAYTLWRTHMTDSNIIDLVRLAS
jgi:glycosyltransferase involved in cell wall biosynthesis